MIKIYFIFFIWILTYSNADCQIWQVDSVDKGFYLQHRTYNTFDGILKVDSSYLFFTNHSFGRGSDRLSEILVSKVNEYGKVIVIKKLDYYAEFSLKKYYNNKFYILEADPKWKRGIDNYRLFIYNKDLQLQKQLPLRDTSTPPRQYQNFVVDKEGSIYLISSPSFWDDKPQHYKGAYLIKVDSSCNFIKKVAFDSRYLRDVNINNDTLALTFSYGRMNASLDFTDSLITIYVNDSLRYISKAVLNTIAIDQKFNDLLYLKNGNKIIVFDSSYNIKSNSWGLTHNLVLLDKNNNRTWTVAMPKECVFNFSNSVALQNGGFIVDISIYGYETEDGLDRTLLVQFDNTGTQKAIKQFIGRGMYSNLYFFEAKPNEIWLFYQKYLVTRQERIYFEKLYLNGKK